MIQLLLSKVYQPVIKVPVIPVAYEQVRELLLEFAKQIESARYIYSLIREDLEIDRASIFLCFFVEPLSAQEVGILESFNVSS